MRVRSLVAWVPVDASPGAAAAGADGEQHWQADRLQVRYVPRDAAGAGAAPGGALPALVLGDDAECAAGHDGSLAGGVPVRFDATARRLVLHTSIVALPPVFLYRGPRVIAVASDLASLVEVPGVRLSLDPAAVTELGRFGHPVGHRTLFRDVELVPGGSTLTLGADGTVRVERHWQLPAGTPLSWPDFIESQVAAFKDAVHRTSTVRSFLSLTAGLDTRTVFAALADEGRLVPGVTITGTRPSLDARTAARLCRAYGVQHQSVTIDDRFVRDLPHLVETASRLSGGLASLDQAPEVFLYDQLGGAFSARWSGNLGNQVGRGGTEGVSLRGAELGILAPALRHETGSDEHWLLGKLRGDARSALEFILQHEIAFTSVGNYCIGSHFAAQLSPYADRTLIETLARYPVSRETAPSGSRLHMRLRDLRHRFLGEPERVSFQRTLVHRIGGPAAGIPVNWGWRPAGAVSPTGLAIGVATLAGMAARATSMDHGALGGLISASGLPALHDFRDTRRWLRVDLQAFTRDTLGAQPLRAAGLFDEPRLSALLDEHFSGRRDHYHSVTFALDVALAWRLFVR